jgi:hypothetical protein
VATKENREAGENVQEFSKDGSSANTNVIAKHTRTVQNLKLNFNFIHFDINKKIEYV